MKDWRGLPRDPRKPGDMLSPSDLAWRIGATESQPPEADVDAERRAGATPTTPVGRRRSSTTGRHTQRIERPAVHQVLLLRDAAGLLFGAVAILLIVQLAAGYGGQPARTPAAAQGPAQPSGVAIGGAVAGNSPGATIGPVVDPNLVPILEESSTPIPVTTPAPPTQKPRATPRPT
ncbi:MAG: hypothetical protein ABI555_09065, partial [Chloroflexota bacterium]